MLHPAGAEGLGKYIRGVIVNELGWLTIVSEFDSHWVPHTFGLVQNYAKLRFGLIWFYGISTLSGYLMPNAVSV